MSHTDDEVYYRSNTVELNTSQVKVTPREDTSRIQNNDGIIRSGQNSGREPNHHSDTPNVTDRKRERERGRISPTQSAIAESRYEQRKGSRVLDDDARHVTRKITGKHTYTLKGRPIASSSLDPTLSNVEEEGEEFVKRGLLSSPPLSPGQRDLVYQSSIQNPRSLTNTTETEGGRQLRGDNPRHVEHTKTSDNGQMTREHSRQLNPPSSQHPGNQADESSSRVVTDELVPQSGNSETEERVVYLIRSPRKSAVNSVDSTDTIGGNSKRSTLEDELQSLSTTPRYSHEDLGRIVSPPDSPSDYDENEKMITAVDEDMKSILIDTNSVKQDMVSQESRRIDLQTRLQDLEEDIKDLHVKLATLRVKLGVANANTNVSKTESEQLRKKFQETQIQMARLEERSKSCNAELERLKDPNNPDSNVNMKKVVVNDRKEIRRLRNELEGVRSERIEARKQMEDQDDRIESLKRLITEAQEQIEASNHDYEGAKIRSDFEEKEREEMEQKCAEMSREKEQFESEFSKLTHQLESTLSDTSTIHKMSEQYKAREQDFLAKIASADRKLRDVLTEIEQQKNRNMPQRTASSIKYHQYRMSATSGIVTDTTPHVVVTSNPKGSIAASGYLGKTVVSQKVATSLPSRSQGNKQSSRGKPGSLPSKR